MWKDICLKINKDLLFASDLALGYFLAKHVEHKSIDDARFKACSMYNRAHNEKIICGCTRLYKWDEVFTLHYMDPVIMKEFHDYILDKGTPVETKWTLVTAFFNLRKYPGQVQEGAIPIESYLEHAKFVLSLRVNLVIFCDEEFVDFFNQERKKHGLSNYTMTVIKSLDQFSFFKYKEKVEHNRAYFKPVPDKRNTPVWSLMCCSKIEMVKQVIEANYFKSDFYAWIDIGIAKVAGPHKQQLYRALKEYREKCSFCYIHYTPKSIMNDLNQYYNFGRCGTACTFYTGSKNNLLKLYDLFKEEFVKTVEAGFLHADEQLIPYIYMKNPDFFEFYYGDYHTLLINYDKQRVLAYDTIHKIIIPTCNDGMYKMCQTTCLRLKSAIDQGYLILDNTDTFYFYNCLFISSYYLL